MQKSPNYITKLQPDEIFVFGSNLAGMHGGGAARLAYQRFGAVWGQGVGLQGQSYAIPTMQGGVETIQPYVDEFIEFAKQHPQLKFLVTEIGCVELDGRAWLFSTWNDCRRRENNKVFEGGYASWRSGRKTFITVFVIVRYSAMQYCGY